MFPSVHSDRTWDPITHVGPLQTLQLKIEATIHVKKVKYAQRILMINDMEWKVPIVSFFDKCKGNNNVMLTNEYVSTYTFTGTFIMGHKWIVILNRS